MSTYCALHVNTAELQPILAVLEKWLQETLGSVTTRGSLTAFPEDFYASLFADELPPSIFVLEQAPPGWVTVHYNSFHDLTALAERLSERCSARVITVMAQSVSEAYFIRVTEKGQVLRTLYYAGDQGEWIRQEGKPFPFESGPLGANISDDPSEPFYVFGREDTIGYCRNLGLELWGDHEEADTWWLIAGPPEGRGGNSVTASPAPEPDDKRPWWKFW